MHHLIMMTVEAALTINHACGPNYRHHHRRHHRHHHHHHPYLSKFKLDIHEISDSQLRTADCPLDWSTLLGTITSFSMFIMTPKGM